MFVAESGTFLYDYSKGKNAAIKMVELFDRKPKINNWEPESAKKIEDEMFSGNIVFNSCQFHYPTRPDVKVLNSFMFSVKKSQSVALVGASGCGKSTVTQLLERFYDPSNGEITISGVNLKDLDLFWLRSQISLVSQEPILFDTTIAENIAYGCEAVTLEKVMEAAKQANIHDFIAKLPKVGSLITFVISTKKKLLVLGIWNKCWIQRVSVIRWRKTKDCYCQSSNKESKDFAT